MSEEIIEPGAFESQIGKTVPLTYGVGGPVIGRATVIGDGVVEMTIDDDAPPPQEVTG